MKAPAPLFTFTPFTQMMEVETVTGTRTTKPLDFVNVTAVCLVLLCSLFVSGVRVRAGEQTVPEQVQDAPQDLQRGIQLVEEGDFAEASDVLAAIVSGQDGISPDARDAALAWLYLGIARLYLAGDDEAREAFYEAQRRDPAIQPETTEFPTRVINVWEEARDLGAIMVTTEPAGAEVYLGGVMRGHAPIEVMGLPPGEYRAMLMMDGYVDHSRVVTVAPGRNEVLDIALTPAAASATSVEAGGGGGGGWWRWAALAGGGAVATYFLLPKNEPPVAAAMVSPTGAGMAGATTYRFDGGGSSDPDNDQLTYSWNFGDGNRGSGVNARHVYASPGRYPVTLTVSDGKEQATTTRSVTVARNLDGGVFSSSFRVSGGGITINFSETIRLSQNGSNLQGSSTSTGQISGRTSISGDVSSNSDFVCPCAVRLSGGSGYRFSGTVDNGADVLSGRLSFQIRLGERTGTITISSARFTRQ